jgi:hypothetical protein
MSQRSRLTGVSPKGPQKEQDVFMIYGEASANQLESQESLDRHDTISGQQKSIQGPLDKLKNIDFSNVEQYDPSREDGFTFPVFEVKIPVHI